MIRPTTNESAAAECNVLRLGARMAYGCAKSSQRCAFEGRHNPLYYGRSSLRTHGRTHKHHTERSKTQQTYHGVTNMDNLVDSAV